MSYYATTKSAATARGLKGRYKLGVVLVMVNDLPSSESSVDMLVDHLGILGMCWRSSDTRCKALCLALRSTYST